MASRSLAEFLQATDLPSTNDAALLYLSLRNAITRADHDYSKRHMENVRSKS